MFGFFEAPDKTNIHKTAFSVVVCDDILLSTMTDNLKKEVGSYWENISLTIPTGYEWTAIARRELPDKYDSVVEDDRGRFVYRASTYSTYIHKIQINPYRIRPYSAETIVPNYMIPVRLYSNESQTLGDKFWQVLFMGGSFAKEKYPPLINMDKVFYQEAFYISNPYSELQRKKLNRHGLVQEADPYDMTCNYNSHYPIYEEFASNLESELLIPNLYLLDTLGSVGISYSSESETIDESSAAILDFVYGTIGSSLVNYATGISSKHFNSAFLKEYMSGDVSVSTSTKVEAFFEDLEKFTNAGVLTDPRAVTEWLHSYITGDYPLLLSTDIEAAKHRQENMLLDASFMYEYDVNLMEARSKFFPYCAKIHFPRSLWRDEIYEGNIDYINRSTKADKDDCYLFLPSIIRSGADSKFLEMLKSIHHNEIPSLEFKKRKFHRGYMGCTAPAATSSLGTGTDTPPVGMMLTTETEEYRTLDLLEIFAQAYNQKSGSADNFFYPGWDNMIAAESHPTPPETIDDLAAGSLPSAYSDYDVSRPPRGVILRRQAVNEDSTADRATVAAAMAQTLGNICEGLREYFTVNSSLDLYLSGEDDEKGRDDSSLYTDAGQDMMRNLFESPMNYSEMLAYRIEKTPVSSSSDHAIQNTWLLNSFVDTDDAAEGIDLEQFVFYDTQVKYNQEYTYNIYGYVAVLGHKYKYGDFRLTKQIGTIETDEEAYAAEHYCLQFYDPLTLDFADQQFFEGTGIVTHLDPADAVTDPAVDINASVLAGRNEFATNQQEISQFPQLADFNLYIEPCVTLVEIPLMSKDIRILDNPGNHTMVEPYQYLDNSNRLGFDIKYEGFLQYPYPATITDKDKKLKTDYLRTMSLLDGDNVWLRSVSLERYIEVYRTETKPTSLEDFAGNLIKTIDLKIDKSPYTQSDAFFDDKIDTNKTYYYLFRFLNEHRMPGHISPILTCKLVDDGGYKYSLFDVLSELQEVDSFTKPSKEFKKLFQIKPNVLQLSIDDKLVDYDETAADNVEDLQIGMADDLMWGKTFKLRLTSKKTGKKLDLNLTFNLQTESTFSEDIFTTGGPGDALIEDEVDGGGDDLEMGD